MDAISNATIEQTRLRKLHTTCRKTAHTPLSAAASCANERERTKSGECNDS